MRTPHLPFHCAFQCQVITVYEMGEARGLLDGQHRVGALKMLAESEVLMPEAHLILVEVFPVLQQEDVKRCVFCCCCCCVGLGVLACWGCRAVILCSQSADWLATPRCCYRRPQALHRGEQRAARLADRHAGHGQRAGEGHHHRGGRDAADGVPQHVQGRCEGRRRRLVGLPSIHPSLAHAHAILQPKNRCRPTAGSRT